MKSNTIIIAIIVLLFSSFTKQSVAQQLVFHNKDFLSIISDLENQHFNVKTIKEKYNRLIITCTPVNDSTVSCNDKNTYDAFLNEWVSFISSLKGKQKSIFLKYAKKHHLENDKSKVQTK